jgi:hypothetical protein
MLLTGNSPFWDSGLMSDGRRGLNGENGIFIQQLHLTVLNYLNNHFLHRPYLSRKYY